AIRAAERRAWPLGLDDPRRPRLIDVQRPVQRPQLRVLVLADQAKQPVVERLAWRCADRLDALAQPLAVELERAVVTHRIVARASQQWLADRRTAALAHILIIAARAQAPQL